MCLPNVKFFEQGRQNISKSHSNLDVENKVNRIKLGISAQNTYRILYSVVCYIKKEIYKLIEYKVIYYFNLFVLLLFTRTLSCQLFYKYCHHRTDHIFSNDGNYFHFLIFLIDNKMRQPKQNNI